MPLAAVAIEGGYQISWRRNILLASDTRLF